MGFIYFGILRGKYIGLANDIQYFEIHATLCEEYVN